MLRKKLRRPYKTVGEKAAGVDDSGKAASIEEHSRCCPDETVDPKGAKALACTSRNKAISTRIRFLRDVMMVVSNAIAALQYSFLWSTMQSQTMYDRKL